MKVELLFEEWYPVAELSPERDDPVGAIIEIPDELMERYAAALREFHAVQGILDALHERRSDGFLPTRDALDRLERGDE